MTRGTEQELIRLLHGELPPDEARELRARLRREPELAEAFGRLERTWSGLALPPPSPVPAGFAGRVMARARSLPAHGGALSWTAAPRWVRATAAAALLAGAALGVGVGRSWPAAGKAPEPAPVSSLAATEATEYSLAEGYWDGVDDTVAITPDAGEEIQR
jgi:anti-sigma factor RsiW